MQVLTAASSAVYSAELELRPEIAWKEDPASCRASTVVVASPFATSKSRSELYRVLDMATYIAAFCGGGVGQQHLADCQQLVPTDEPGSREDLLVNHPELRRIREFLLRWLALELVVDLKVVKLDPHRCQRGSNRGTGEVGIGVELQPRSDGRPNQGDVEGPATLSYDQRQRPKDLRLRGAEHDQHAHDDQRHRRKVEKSLKLRLWSRGEALK